jgi:coenzyme F420 hydrogenase subunit beta
MKVFGSKELKHDVIDRGLCIGCGACIGICPYFETYRGKTANLFPCTLEQGRCFAYCPQVEVDLEALAQQRFGRSYDGSPLGPYSTIRTAKAGPRAKAGNFQSGGTVSALMDFALQQGTIDAAILTDQDGILPVPRLVTDPKDVYACAGSKYASAPTLAELNRAIKSGYQNLGLVVTPCQAMAVAQLKSNPLNESHFTDPVALVVGLICTWSLNHRTFEPYLKEIVPIDSIKRIDIPPPPAEVLEIYTDGEKIEVPLAEVREKVADSCEYCPDMTAEFSDLSVGVFEGQSDLNTLIIRSDAGAELVAEAQRDGYLILGDMPSENLDHLTWAAENKKKKALSKNREEGLLDATTPDERATFRFNGDITEGL